MNISTLVSQIIIDNPFYGVLLLKLEIKEDSTVATMATDGKTLKYNMDFVDSLTKQEVIGVLIHELYHCMFIHMTRMDTRDPSVWNQACDYVVNYEIIKNTKYQLPEDRLYDEDYNDWTAEAVYEDLMKDPDKQDDNFSEATGEFTEGDPEDTEDYWKDALSEAVTAFKDTDHVPNTIEGYVANLLHPKLDWKTILRDFITTKVKSDYSFNRPNRRFIHQGMILPSLDGDKIGNVVIAVDTSCSVDDAELDIMQAEINAIIEDVRPTSTTVIMCDTKVHNVVEYDEFSYPVILQFKGRGGTDLSPPFEYVEKSGSVPDCFIYLSDLEADFDFPQPPYPVIWVNTYDNKTAPFGETITIN